MGDSQPSSAKSPHPGQFKDGHKHGVGFTIVSRLTGFDWLLTKMRPKNGTPAGHLLVFFRRGALNLLRAGTRDFQSAG